MTTSPTPIDVLIIGAGAAGMMCAIEAGRRGRRVTILEQAAKPGEKIRISGGGRCNFTNLHCGPGNFLSQNPHFCKSALARYTQQDFLKLIAKHNIAWHEKTLGQLFCDVSAGEIIAMLRREMTEAGVTLHLGTRVQSVTRAATGFDIQTDKGRFEAAACVVAAGGLSIPKIGTDVGYRIARQAGHKIIETRAGLVPLLFDENLLKATKPLSGLAVEISKVSYDGQEFSEALLFTHRGLSGPAILQISSYWAPGGEISVNLAPQGDIFEELRKRRQEGQKSLLHNALARFLPQRLAELIAAEAGADLPLADLSDQKLRAVAERVHRWKLKPTGTEGYRTAEVTLGGVDTNELSSKTMESRKMPGLYFIGEIVDVTGHLGGHNFQWAWSSGWCAGQYC